MVTDVVLVWVFRGRNLSGKCFRKRPQQHIANSINPKPKTTIKYSFSQNITISWKEARWLVWYWCGVGPPRELRLGRKPPPLQLHQNTPSLSPAPLTDTMKCTLYLYTAVLKARAWIATSPKHLLTRPPAKLLKSVTPKTPPPSLEMYPHKV